MQINISVLGVDATRRELDALKSRPAARQLWGTVAQIMHAETMQNFQTEKAPNGTAWKPLAPITLMLRQKRNQARRLGRGRNVGNVKILQDTGRLRGSIVTKHGEGWAEVGTTLHYAPLHQFGGRSTWGIVPARPFIGLSQSMAKRVRDAVEHWLGGGV